MAQRGSQSSAHDRPAPLKSRLTGLNWEDLIHTSEGDPPCELCAPNVR